MPRRLILMRHAKSSWKHPGLFDHARPLNGRGRASAQALGHWLRDRGYLPDEALVSDAVRTQETWERLGLDAPADLREDLYHADPATLMAALREATGDCVLMLGHNPGLGDFALSLTDHAPAHPRFEDFPTGATLVADFDIDDWRKLAPGTGTALDFVIPRELLEEGEAQA